MGGAAPNQVNTLSELPLTIVDANPSDTKVVGQRIELRVEVASGAPLEDVGWDIPGSPVADFTMNNKTAASKAVPRDGQLYSTGSDRIVFYWTSGGSHRVRVHGIVAGRAGTGSMAFVVEEPTIFSTELAQGTVGIRTFDYPHSDPPLVGRFLALGTDPGTGPGIKWKFDLVGPKSYDGDVIAVQTITSRRAFDFENMTDYEVDTRGEPYLDGRPGAIAYGSEASPLNLSLGKSRSTVLESEDTPSIYLDSSPHLRHASVSESFLLYVLYKPFASRSIHVPVLRVPWRWCGKAYRGDSTMPWMMSKPDPSADNAPLAKLAVERTPIHPRWVGHIRALEDEVEESRRRVGGGSK